MISSYHRSFNRTQVDVGIHAFTYQRNHWLINKSETWYLNKGQKQEGSAFIKLNYPLSDNLNLYIDVNGRLSRFNYISDTAAHIPDQDIVWKFVNPKIGLVQRFGDYSVFGSVGRTKREPTRIDLFAGADNLPYNVSFSDVKPEQVTDIELGGRFNKGFISGSITGYAMEFRDEIVPIGQLAPYSGLPLRKNVTKSFRRGVEIDITYQPTEIFTIAGNITYQFARLRYFEVEKPIPHQNEIYRNVVPVLSPKITSSVTGTFQPKKWLRIYSSGQFRSKMYLDNTANEDLSVPNALTVDGGVTLLYHQASLTADVINITKNRYSSGATMSDPISQRTYATYFAAAPRVLFLTLRYAL